MPKLNPTRKRVAHVDLAETGDALGISIGHYAGHVEREKIVEVPGLDGKVEVRRVIENRPTSIIDVMVKIEPQTGRRLDIGMAKMILIAFGKICGFKYEYVTYDQYQSSESINALNQMGIKSERYSVDRTDEAYMMFHSAVMQKRVSFYQSEQLIEDCGSLQHNMETHKVDHIPGGTKDMSDCVAACVRHVEVLHPKTTMALGPVRGMVADLQDQVDRKKREFMTTLSGLSPSAQKEQERIREMSKDFSSDVFSGYGDVSDAGFWDSDD